MKNKNDIIWKFCHGHIAKILSRCAGKASTKKIEGYDVKFPKTDPDTIWPQVKSRLRKFRYHAQPDTVFVFWRL